MTSCEPSLHSEGTASFSALSCSLPCCSGRCSCSAFMSLDIASRICSEGCVCQVCVPSVCVPRVCVPRVCVPSQSCMVQVFISAHYDLLLPSLVLQGGYTHEPVSGISNISSALYTTTTNSPWSSVLPAAPQSSGASASRSPFSSRAYNEQKHRAV